MYTRVRSAPLCFVFASMLVFGGGCLPPTLEKYREQSAAAKKGDPFAIDPLLPGGSAVSSSRRDVQPAGGKPPPDGSTAAGSWESKGALGRQEAAGIFAVDEQTYRIIARDDAVWDVVLDVLLKHYTLTIVDKSSGILSTEWDTFIRANVAYRNKLSLRVRTSGRTSVDLTIRNNVERLRRAGEDGAALGGVWLPSGDPGQEVRRIVQNVALLLALPPPVFPPDGVVARPEDAGKSM